MQTSTAFASIMYFSKSFILLAWNSKQIKGWRAASLIWRHQSLWTYFVKIFWAHRILSSAKNTPDWPQPADDDALHWEKGNYFWVNVAESVTYVLARTPVAMIVSGFTQKYVSFCHTFLLFLTELWWNLINDRSCAARLAFFSQLGREVKEERGKREERGLGYIKKSAGKGHTNFCRLKPGADKGHNT